MNVRKRGLALLMCICMIFTLLPFSALADATTQDVVYGKYGANGWEQKDTAGPSETYTSQTGANIKYSKEAKPVEGEADTYEITLKIESTTTKTSPGASAVVLSIDISTSMYYCTICGRNWEDNENHTRNCSYEGKVLFEQTRLHAAREAAVSFINNYAGSKDGVGRYLQIVSFQGYGYTNLSNWIDVSKSDNKTTAINTVNALEPVYKGSSANGTNLEQGLSRAKNCIISTPDGIAKDNKFAVVLTDGAPNRYGSNSFSALFDSTIYNKTIATAKMLKKACSVYTVCFGASNDTFNGSTVGNFLKNDIASSPNCAYNADSVSALNAAFTKIFEEINHGLSSGFTVNDPMGANIVLQSQSITDAVIDNNGNGFIWTPTDPSEIVPGENGAKTYIYTVTYRVKLNTSAEGFVDGKYYPTNDDTTLKFKDGETDKTLQFNVPGVKGTAPEYTVTYRYANAAPEGATDVTTLGGSYKKDATVTVAAKPSVDGWTFSGWSVANDSPTNPTITDNGQFNMPNGNVVLEGSWTQNSYTVMYKPGDHGTFNNNGTPVNQFEYVGKHYGDATPAAPTTDANSESGTIVPNEGYYFTGWEPTRAETVTGNATYIAQYEKLNNLSYTVHYYLNGTTQKVKDDKFVDGKTFEEVVTETYATIDGYTFAGTADEQTKTITIGVENNKIIFYYYQNVTLTANSKTVTYNGEEHIVSGFTGAPEGADFSDITVGAKGTDANTYPANFAERTVGTVDATGKYIVTDVVNGNLVIEAAYQVQYEYKNAPADAPACPIDDTYYADNTTVTLQQPGTAPTGYKFVGWKVDGTGDVVTEVTINGANVRLVGEWEPVTGLSYVVHYYWVGTEDKVAPDKTVDKQTFGTVITSETPIQVPNYKAVPEQVSNLTISTENEKNVITFYYYKNIELTANNGEAKYDGTLKTVDGFKAIVAADNGADIYEQLKEVLAAHGQGTDAGRYDVCFTRGGEIIPATDLVGRVLNDKYWVTKADQGKLTITPRSLIITSASDSKYYDGTPLTNKTITVTGDGFVNGEGATYKVTGSQTEVGSSKNTFDVIFKDNTKATNYVVEKKLGDLTVNRRPMPPVNPPIMDEIIVEITGNSDSVVYDGAEHSVKGYTVKISDPRYTEKDFTFTGKAEASGVNAGTYEMGLKAEQFKNTNARFTNVKFVIKADGVLTITPKDLIITAGSKTEYGPTPVTCDEWTVSGLAAGDKVESVKITGIQSVPGSSPNVPSDAVIKNAKGEDVTKNYAIKYVNGTLTMLEVLNKEDHFNYIIGTPEGLSLPTANVTRAEVATIFFRLMTDDARAKFDSLDNNFSDVAKGKWYNRAISTLANAGIIKGDPAGTYRPDDPITRAEMAAIIARFGDFKEGGKTFSDISGHWAQKYIELAASNGWINGNPDGTFKPNNNITRAETVAMINRVLDRQTKDVSDLLPVSQMTNWSDNMDTAKWYYRDMQEATNNHKAERVGDSIYEKWTEKLPDIDWASYQI